MEPVPAEVIAERPEMGVRRKLLGLPGELCTLSFAIMAPAESDSLENEHPTIPKLHS